MSPDMAPPVRRILTVEDEPDHLMAVEMLFRGEPGIEFFGAGTTAEADEILRREAIDLILLDLALPGEDGLSFCKRIKAQERYRAIPVVAFSAFPRQIYESRAREVGCIDYFDKPFHPRDLIAAVRKHLTAGS
jgi:DNA-binding response OmpR family regulator